MLDGTQVAMHGAKVANFSVSNPEKLSLLSTLGGIRDLDCVTEPKYFFIKIIANISGNKPN